MKICASVQDFKRYVTQRLTLTIILANVHTYEENPEVASREIQIKGIQLSQ